jgi:hypothetical protein
MSNTATELEQMVCSVGCELVAIAYGERWKLANDTEQLTKEQAIVKIIDTEGEAEFVAIIESLFGEVIDYEDKNAIRDIIYDDILDYNGTVSWTDIIGVLRDGGYIEKYSIWDYFSDCLGIEYRIDGSRDFRGVEVCVACGGPGIYVNGDKVWGIWGRDRAEYCLNSVARDMVYDWGAEMYSTIR